MSLKEFEYTGEYDEDGMDGWFELYDEENHEAWIATDSPMTLLR